MLTGLLYTVFIFSCLLLIGIILIQEGKGGGLSDAFGGMGGETFGHRAGPVTKITAFLAALMIVSLIALHKFKSNEPNTGLFQPKDTPTAPGSNGAGGGNGAGANNQPTVPPK